MATSGWTGSTRGPSTTSTASLGAEIGAATILKVHLVARGALDRAVRWGWLARNPAAAAEPPPVRPPVIRPPTPEELALLLVNAEREDPVFALWLRVAAATGARRGELCALRWNDLDFEARTVTIERGVVVVEGGVLERPTKTHNRRTLALDDTTLELLAGHRQREQKTAVSCGGVLESDAFVFSRRPGGTQPLRPDNCTWTFQKLLRRTGLSGFSLKDATRHLAATRLVAAGVDIRTVAGRLGHARTSTTLDVYSHWQPGRDREAAAILGQLLDAPDASPSRDPGAGALGGDESAPSGDGRSGPRSARPVRSSPRPSCGSPEGVPRLHRSTGRRSRRPAPQCEASLHLSQRQRLGVQASGAPPRRL